MIAPEQSDIGDGWVQGRVGNVVLTLYQADVPERAVARSFELIDRTIASHPQGIALFAMFGERAPAPSAQMVREIGSHLAQNADRFLIGCTVIEGESMGAMTKRAATTMLTTVLRPPYPHRAFRSIALGCAYLAPKAVDDSGAPLSAPELAAAVDVLRSRITR